MRNIKDKAIAGVKWQSANQILQKVISVATFAVLARILEPAVFGIMAMAFIAIEGLGMFKTFGLDAGLVQKKDCPDEAKHTTFIMIQAMGLLLFLLCFAAAPVAGAFFGNEQVTSILRALGIVFIMSGFGRVPGALLNKQMRFRALSVIQIIGALANSIFAVSFALISPTIWSLVWAYLIKQVTMTALTWYLSGYRFRFTFNPTMAKSLFHFGKFLLGVSIIWYVSRNLNNAVVGKLVGATALGYFALATNVSNFINTHFTAVVSRVMFPAFSAIQEDPDRVKRAYLKSIKYIAMLAIPFSFGLITISQEFVLMLYGEKWLPTAPLIQLLGFVHLFSPIAGCSGSLFRGCGKPSYEFNVGLLSLFLSIPLVIVFTRQWGVTGTAIATIVLHVILCPVNVILSQRMIGFRWREFFSQISTPLAAGACFLIAVLLVKETILNGLLSGTVASTPILSFLILAMTGTSAYGLAFYLIERSVVIEFREILFKKSSRSLANT